MTDPLRGYTLHHIANLARQAALATGGNSRSFDDRYDEAWSAIAEALLSAEQMPTRRELYYAGLDAVREATKTDLRHHGVDYYDRDAGRESGARFARYWSARVTPDFSDGLVERYAAYQIWPTLTSGEQAVLLAYAAGGGLVAVEQAMGVSPAGAKQRMQRARQRFRAAWHEHETPTRMRTANQPRRADDELKPCGTRSAYYRHKKRGEPIDEACRGAVNAHNRETVERQRLAGKTRNRRRPA